MGGTRTAPRPQDVAGGDSAPAATLRQRIDDWFKANASRLSARWDHPAAPYGFGAALALVVAGMLIGLAILAGHVAVFAVALIAPVAAVALLCGLGPGLVAALTGPFALMWYVNPPGSVATGQTTSQTAELGLLMFVSVSVAVIVGRSEAARQRSDAENAGSWRRRSRRVASVGRTYPPSPGGRGSQTRARPRPYT